MKKTILIWTVVVLLLMPIVFAVWWNPFTWDIFSRNDNTAVNMYGKEIISYTHLSVTNFTFYYKVECDGKNLSEACDGTYANGSKYYDRSYEKRNYVYENRTRVENISTGIVNYTYEGKSRLFALEGMWSIVYKDSIMSYDCRDGRCSYGEGELKSGETGCKTSIKTGETVCSNSLKKNIIAKIE